MSKRGMMDDMAFIIMGGFFLATTLLVIMVWSGYVQEALGGIETLEPSANATVQGVMSDYPAVFDNTFAFVVIGLMLISLVLLYFIPITPALFFFIVLIIAVFSIVAGYVSNAWGELTATEFLAPMAASMSKTDFFMSNLMVIVMLYAFAALIVFFAKPQQEGYA